MRGLASMRGAGSGVSGKADGSGFVSRTEVPMPQMGESIAEGTVSKWLKRPGDAVERDEPILEISTDKVDAEIPSPSAGVLAEIRVEEGETVEVGTVVALIDAGRNAASGDGAPGDDSDHDSAADASGSDAASVSGEAGAVSVRDGGDSGGDSPPEGSEDSADGAPEDSANCTATSEDRLRTRSTPVVRRIAEEAGVDIAKVPGTGHLGRVTKQDILSFIEQGGAEGLEDGDGTPDAAVERTAEPIAEPDAHRPPATSGEALAAPSETESGTEPTTPVTPAAPPDGLWDAFHSEVRHPAFPVRDGDRVERMTKVRRLTAEHMVLAKRIAAHVHSVIEIDFTAVDRIRREKKAKWAEQGARVSYTAFVAWACSRILRDFPSVNGVISGDNIIQRGSVSIGVAVDLNPGLIVPVIHNADHLSLVGIASRIIDLAERARSRQLSPDEIQGATFTITNPGVLGTVVGMPVIPKGTSAILGTGSIEKRVVAVTDPASGEAFVAIRKRSYFSLGYDHRLVDGADSARFLSRLKAELEGFPEDA